ncbi:MAG: type III-A CRISPR-associated protein Cas10/Csm1 [Candidatus Omnitrophica bacterium]|nr:type III-A CRISPR-associated protein Cas10/Csm1 [Candidatus Omnitrophota bacterium]
MKFKSDRNYNTIILAGLLHDLGKLLQRGESYDDQQTKGKHPEVGAEFISNEKYRDFFSKRFNFNLLETLIRRHHTSHYPDALLAQKAQDSDLPYTLLISEADNYSSKERGEKNDKFKPYKLVPLTSIFNHIKIYANTQESKGYKLSITYKPSECFPKSFDSFNEGEYNELISAFKSKFDSLIDIIDPNNEDMVYSVLYNLLLEFGWCVPSNTQEDEPDVSLFDHLKTTSAISACLFQTLYPSLSELINKQSNFRDLIRDYEEKNNGLFVLLMGDLSGIQDYIFALAKVGAGAISKRLRARSFKLAMISHWVSYKILKQFELPYANLISASGGNFVILLPNLPNINDELEKIQKELDEHLMKQFSGEIALHLAWIPFASNQFSQTEFPKLLEEAHSRLKIKKNKPFYNILVQNGNWDEAKFVFSRSIDSEDKVCVICRRHPGESDPKEDNQIVCNSCKNDRELGTKLVNAKGVAFYENDPGQAIPILDAFFVPLTEISNAPGKPLFILSFEPASLETDVKAPTFPSFIANHIPKADSNNFCENCDNYKDCELEEKPLEKNQNLLFECIAQKARGRKYLAMLKADVDNLGELFKEGLKDRGSISRYTTLSRMLDLFFCGWIQETIAEKYPLLYMVYSGGDDLMIIGPWDQIIEFSIELDKEFKRFTGYNPDFHFSASIIIGTPHTPVNFIARKADEMLELAKHKDDEKDKLSALGDLIKWEKVALSLKEAKKVANWINNDKISVSFVRNLLYYSHLFEQYQETQKADYLRFIPLLTYDIARNLPKLDDEDKEKQEVRQWAETLKNQASALKGEKITRLKFISTYALMAKEENK